MKARKILWAIGIIAALIFSQPADLHAASKAKEKENVSDPLLVIVDGKPAALDQAPIMAKGTTLVPFRPIFESLGMQVKWDSKAQTVTGTSDSLQIKLTIGQSHATVNGKKVKLTAAPVIKKGGTYVPLRFVGEAAGRTVQWDPEFGVITVNLEGADKLYYDNGLLLYEGGLVNGSMHGKGRIYLPTGVLIYEGEVANDTMHGKGKLYNAKGQIWYEADFVENSVTGKGKLYFYGSLDGPDKLRQTYEGDLVDGIPQGQGKYYDFEGDLVYEGDVVDGEPDGKGSQYSRNSKMYTGEFKNGRWHGKGTTFYKNGQVRHEGTFKDGMGDGYGKEYDESGNLIYEGEFKFHDYDGQGTLYDANGQIVHQGLFSKDKPVKP